MDYDDAYANAPYIAGGTEYPERWEARGLQYRALEASVGRARLNEPYGATDRERFDLFMPSGTPEGLIFFVHGGFWRMLGRGHFAWIAEGAREVGWATALPSYRLAPEARIPEITQEVRAALIKAAARVPGPLVLAGHSAGGHLVARMAMADMDLSPVVASRIERIVSISPLSDLRPMLQMAYNSDWQLTGEDAQAESPALHAKYLDVPVHVWVGADERAAFLDQARWLATAWDAPLTEEAGRNHYDVIESL
ncbi:MAG: alpha/beta hydrolase, partial [Pseudomonadota bacterium]